MAYKRCFDVAHPAARNIKWKLIKSHDTAYTISFSSTCDEFIESNFPSFMVAFVSGVSNFAVKYVRRFNRILSHLADAKRKENV